MGLGLSLSSLSWLTYLLWIVKLDSDYSRTGSFIIFSWLNSFGSVIFCEVRDCAYYHTADVVSGRQALITSNELIQVRIDMDPQVSVPVSSVVHLPALQPRDARATFSIDDRTGDNSKYKQVIGRVKTPCISCRNCRCISL